MVEAESFLERALKKQASMSGPVPSELLESWADDSDEVPAAFLLHPAVRGHGDGPAATEEDVRKILSKKKLLMSARVSTSDFTKLAGRIQTRATSRSGSGSSIGEGAAVVELPAEEAQAVAALSKIVSSPKWRAKDEQPAKFASFLYCGSAEHAADLATLRKLGITAVLNCAPSACEHPVGLYEDSGISYAELDAEDWEGYPLLELHLSAASEFVAQHTRDGGIVLVHCFAGVNRSATLAIGALMMRGKRALPEVIKHCWEERPFILSNESFRLDLVKLAASQGLLMEGRDHEGYSQNYGDGATVNEVAVH